MSSDDRLAAWSRRWEAGDRTVVDEIEAALKANPSLPDIDCFTLGELCERVGLIGPAFHQFQQAVKQRPADPRVLKKLASYYAERGEMVRAGELWQRLLQLQPGDEETVDELASLLVADGSRPELARVLDAATRHGYDSAKADAWLAQLDSPHDEPSPRDRIPSRDDPFPEPTDADCVRFATLFAGREDVYARQWCRPDDRRVGYTPVHEPLTPAVIRQHLLGSFTVGVYPIRLDQTATWFAIDLDIRNTDLETARRDHSYATRLREQMRSTGTAILQALRELSLDPLFENSGYKGRHYWVFLQQPQEARVLHHLGRTLLARLQTLLPASFSLEFFPKQARRSGKGLGNLIKLPLGIHQKTGYRSVLLDDAGRPIADPYQRLRSAERLTQEAFLRLVDRLKVPSGPSPGSRLSARTAAEPMEADRPDSGSPDESADASSEPPSPALPLWPPDAPPPWTEADFDTDRQVHHLLSRCPVLEALKQQVDRHRQLSHDEQVVLIHTLGHLPSGPQAVNYLIHRCVDYAPEMLMKSSLKGNPISCPKIRKRIGHVTRRVPCACDFSFAPNHYPTPLLHLETLPEEAPEPDAPAAPTESDDLEQLIRRYTVLVHRKQEIETEWRELHDALVRRLAAVPDRSWTGKPGRFYLETEEGVETLRWDPPGGD